MARGSLRVPSCVSSAVLFCALLIAAGSEARELTDEGFSESSVLARELQEGNLPAPVTPGSILKVYRGTPIALRAVVYLVEFCNLTNPFRSPQDYRRLAFDEPGSVASNVENFYRTCSYGKVSWSPDNVAIVGPLTLPCNSLSAPFGGGSVMAWMVREVRKLVEPLAANDTKLQQILQWSSRRRSVFILPSNNRAADEGYGTLLCSTDCNSMVKNGSKVHTLIHELQHNMGLEHASSNYPLRVAGMSVDPSGNDDSENMGAYPGNGNRCHNAPNNYRLGWADTVPGGNLSAVNFTRNANRLTFTLPSSGSSDKNMVIVNLANASAPRPRDAYALYPMYFLSYRVKAANLSGYDGGLPSRFHRKVLVHSEGNNIPWRYENGFFIVAGTLLTTYGPRFPDADTRVSSAGDVWTSPFTPFNASSDLGGGLRVKVVSAGPTSAVVEVCRMYSRTEGAPGSAECMANLDLDCDGLRGMADPDCVTK